jgi:hypothetical protein
MTVLMEYSDPLQKDEINEYKVKGIRATFYFWQYVDSFSKNRISNLFLENPIFRGSIFSCLYI